MDVYKIKDLPDDERQTLLLGESIEVNEQAYMKSLSDDELAVRRERIVQVSLMKAVIEDEYQSIKDNFKMKLDPLKLEFGELLDELRVKMVEITGKVYSLPDHDNQMMHFIDIKGNVISSRRMLPEERQYRIPLSGQHITTSIHESRTGTNQD